MHLLPCIRPQGTLESAPRTSLRADSPRERWDGFWCLADERYYARCTRPDGGEAWFRIADESPLKSTRSARVFALRPPSLIGAPSVAAREGRRMLLLASSTGRPILVGTSRRGPRAPARGGVR